MVQLIPIFWDAENTFSGSGGCKRWWYIFHFALPTLNQNQKVAKSKAWFVMHLFSLDGTTFADKKNWNEGEPPKIFAEPFFGVSPTTKYHMLRVLWIVKAAKLRLWQAWEETVMCANSIFAPSKNREFSFASLKREIHCPLHDALTLHWVAGKGWEVSFLFTSRQKVISGVTAFGFGLPKNGNLAPKTPSGGGTLSIVLATKCHFWSLGFPLEWSWNSSLFFWIWYPLHRDYFLHVL